MKAAKAAREAVCGRQVLILTLHLTTSDNQVVAGRVEQALPPNHMLGRVDMSSAVGRSWGSRRLFDAVVTSFVLDRGLPVKSWLALIDRNLCQGGIFVDIGPLDLETRTDVVETDAVSGFGHASGGLSGMLRIEELLRARRYEMVLSAADTGAHLPEQVYADGVFRYNLTVLAARKMTQPGSREVRFAK